jgi:hypothetical protein
VTSLSQPKKTPPRWRANIFSMLDSDALDLPGKFRKRLLAAIDSFAD